MERVAFDPKELEPVEMLANMIPVAPPVAKRNSPITTKENYQLLLNGEKPLWITNNDEFVLLTPSCVPDNWARGMVTNGKMNPPDTLGGKDMFGIEWVFEASVNGSMVKQGEPFVKDLEHWEDYITFPNIDSWDWEKGVEDAAFVLHDGRIVKVVQMTGLFERLISFIGMEDALVAMIDEDVQDAVHRLFDKLCDLYDRLFEKYKKYFDADQVWFHDDWGSQRAPFFSYATVEEMIFPYLKRVTESAHKYGMTMDFHSCGKVESLVPLMVAAGCDSWDGQPLNDKLAIAKQFGDKILVNVVPEVAPDASEEEVAAAIQKTLEDYKGLRFYFGRKMGMNPKITPMTYELSRKFLN